MAQPASSVAYQTTAFSMRQPGSGWVDLIRRERPFWTSTLANSVPVLTHAGYLGMMDMVYVRSIKNYFPFGWHFKGKASPNERSELIVYDAAEP